VTIAISVKNISSIGNRYLSQFSAALDSSYPTGGYPFDIKLIGLTILDDLFNVGNAGGFEFNYNFTTKKLQVYSVAGGAAGVTGSTTATNSPSPIAMDPYTPSGGVTLSPTLNEVVAVAANVGTLSLQPSIVQNIYITAGGVTGPATIIPGGTAPAATGEVSVDSVAATITFFPADAVTAASVTYMNRGAGFAGTPAALTGNAASQIQAAHTHTIAAGGGGLTEVANGTNLSAVTGALFLAIGE
jgi:hypothetical protein